MKYSEFDRGNIKKIKITYSKQPIDDKNTTLDVLTHSFTCVPSKLYFGENTIIIDIKEFKNFNIQYPQRVFIDFIKDDAVYNFATRLEDITNLRGCINITLTAPNEINRVQMRQFYRVEIANLVILDFDGHDGTHYRMSATSVDISLGGIKIYKPLNLSDGKEIKDKLPLENYTNFEFLIYINDMKVYCKGKFIRSSMQQNKPAYSFEFNYIDKLIYTRFYRYLVNQQCKIKNQTKGF